MLSASYDTTARKAAPPAAPAMPPVPYVNPHDRTDRDDDATIIAYLDACAERRRAIRRAARGAR